VKCGAALDAGARFCANCGAATGAGPSRRRGKWLRRIAVLSVVVGVALVLMAVNMRLFLRVAGYVGVAMFVMGVLVTLLTFRKAKRVSIASLAISMIVPVVTFCLYTRLLGVHLSGGLLVMGFLAGALLGGLWAATNKVYIEQDAVRSQASPWYLLVWGGMVVLNQWVALTMNRAPVAMIALMLVGTGLAFANSGVLILKCRRAPRERRSYCESGVNRSVRMRRWRWG